MQKLLKRFHSFTHGIQLIFSFYKLEPKHLTKSLSNFYTSQSTKRTNTRKKDWPEFEIILEDIKKQFPATSYELPTEINERKKLTAGGRKQEAKLHIVELGCGDGRLAQYLDEKLWVPFTYIGIDAAGGLIQTAKEREFANNVQFFVGDMNLYLAALEQQSVDIIISMASIQHLHKGVRQSLRNNCYRVLQYNGLHITTNRSYSKRMFAKHWKAMIIGFFLRIFNNRTFGFGDFMIPFKTPIDGGMRTDYRFYHLYLLGELLDLAHTAGFVVEKSGYISSDGEFGNDWKSSRNTYVVAKKDVGGE